MCAHFFNTNKTNKHRILLLGGGKKKDKLYNNNTMAGSARVIELPSVVCKVDGVVVIAQAASIIDIPAVRCGRPRSA